MARGRRPRHGPASRGGITMPTQARTPEPAPARPDGAGEVMTLARAIEDLARQGYTEQFYVADGRLRSAKRAAALSTDDAVIRQHRRFEGVSDPDDMAIVYAIETAGGVRGTLVDAFGVYADPNVGAVIARIPVRPDVT